MEPSRSEWSANTARKSVNQLCGLAALGRHAVFQLSEARMSAVGFGGIQIQFGGTAEHMETRFELLGDDLAS